MAQIQDIRLVIKIDNKRPIELLDLTKSLVSLATQFNSYVAKNADSKENSEAKLYIKEIKSGSVILELIELATIGVIPFIENTNTIIEFAKYIKSVLNYFIKNEGEKPELSAPDCKDFSAIINPIAKDNGSQIIISPTINGNVVFNFGVNSLESNALMNMMNQEVSRMKLPEQNDEIKQSVLLTWFQARNDMNSQTGNKGVVEELSKKPLNITFDDEEIKQQMLHSDSNPLITAFVVDVKIQTVQDKPVAYKIMRLHEQFAINNEQ